MGHSTEQQPTPSVIKFTNCRMLHGNSLVETDLWISPDTGKILNGQDVFFGDKIGPSKVIDLQGRIISPGFIETQINGAYGFDFSDASKNPSEYAKGVATLRKGLVQTGVTSFLPTITSQRADVYKKVSNILEFKIYKAEKNSDRLSHFWRQQAIKDLPPMVLRSSERIVKDRS